MHAASIARAVSAVVISGLVGCGAASGHNAVRSARVEHGSSPAVASPQADACDPSGTATGQTRTAAIRAICIDGPARFATGSNADAADRILAFSHWLDSHLANFEIRARLSGVANIPPESKHEVMDQLARSAGLERCNLLTVFEATTADPPRETSSVAQQGISPELPACPVGEQTSADALRTLCDDAATQSDGFAYLDAHLSNLDVRHAFDQLFLTRDTAALRALTSTLEGGRCTFLDRICHGTSWPCDPR